MKHYLFWEKQSIKEFWEKGLFIDKVFMITYSIQMLFFFVAFIVMSLSTDNPLFTGMLLGVLWIVIFLGIPFWGHTIEKSYWIKFEDTYVLRHEAFGYRKNFFYKEAKYIVIGEPYVRPNRSLSEAFYEKLGNYINVLSSDKRILFSVRYSEELLKMLQERCENIEIIKK